MLVHLKIADFGIIDAVELSFGPGLTVLTGETGAGKSMIVGATSCLRGGRTRADWVRNGAAEASVEALFDLEGRHDLVALAESLGIPTDGSELLVRRILSRTGRGRIYINGSLSTAAVLGRLMSGIIDISGQHEHQLLAERKIQLAMLDGAALTEGELAKAEGLYRELVETGQALRATDLDERQRLERIDFLRFQLEELEAAKLRTGEDRELEGQLAIMRRATDLAEVASGAEQELYAADGAVCERLGLWQRRLSELARLDPALSPLAAQLAEGRVLLEDAAQSLGRYAQAVEMDPRALAAAEEREALLIRLRRKYGASVDELLERMSSMSEELATLEALDQRRDALEADLQQRRQRAEAQASHLSATRLGRAKTLQRQISAQVQKLGMKDAEVEIVLSPRSVRDNDDPYLVFGGPEGARRLGKNGWDQVEFQVVTNVGAEMRPLAKVASGGELSRLMLALRQVLGASEPRSISIFDEVDAGVGGATADVIGRSLCEVAQHRQVLVVTHLPQVAAYADTHIHVSKGRAGRGPTTTVAECLEGERRIEEMARMLAASRVTPVARENARQLIETARREAAAL